MNWQSWLVALIVAVIFSAIVVKGIINRKKGKHSCSCGSCSGCVNSEFCHAKK